MSWHFKTYYQKYYTTCNTAHLNMMILSKVLLIFMLLTSILPAIDLITTNAWLWLHSTTTVWCRIVTQFAKCWRCVAVSTESVSFASLVSVVSQIPDMSFVSLQDKDSKPVFHTDLSLWSSACIALHLTKCKYRQCCQIIIVKMFFSLKIKAYYQKSNWQRSK